MEPSSFKETVDHLNELRKFLETAPRLFAPHERIRRFELPNQDVISCIRWDDEFFISGTDILRCIVYRFQAFGRDVIKRTKFEEFVFSDLRSLKTNVRARLEEGKSDLLVFLHENGCIRTKKKQRVFFWDAVPHDQLFLDTLERELRRSVIEQHNDEYQISKAVREPALSIKFDPLLKVGHQIENIIQATPENQREIVCAVFGILHPPKLELPVIQFPMPMQGQPNMYLPPSDPLIYGSHRVRSMPQLRSPKKVPEWHTKSDPGYSLIHYAQTHPSNRKSSLQIKADTLKAPNTNDKKAKKNVDLPSIRDALPVHAQFDLGPIDESE